MKKIVPYNWTDEVGLNIAETVNDQIDNFEVAERNLNELAETCKKDCNKSFSTNFNPGVYV